MLRIDFINVGDGDSVLIREYEQGAPVFTMLVDSGRPQVEFREGSLRASAINYLMKERIGRIDLAVMTHLHFDHMGGMPSVLRNIPVKQLMALYIPPHDAEWIIPPDCGMKTVVGMCDALNYSRDIMSAASEKGCSCLRAAGGTHMLTEKLTMLVYLPDDGLICRQKSAFDRLHRGDAPGLDELISVSKERNCSSLILRLEYAGRSVLLTGDSYADYWEDRGFPHCDILKLPHHGDAKSMTEKLICSLSPEYAVASCQNDTSQKKERPSAAVAEMVQQHVGTFICTENRPLPTLEADAHRAVSFTISDAGDISMSAE